MSQIKSIKTLRVKRAMRLAQNRDQTPFVDIKSCSYTGLGLQDGCNKSLYLLILFRIQRMF